jgi:hypothetical protein
MVWHAIFGNSHLARCTQRDLEVQKVLYKPGKTIMLLSNRQYTITRIDLLFIDVPL